MNYLTQNTKLKKDNIFAFSLPAGFTCPGAGECKKYCYAQKGNYRFGNVQRALKRNLALTRNPITFIETMSAEIARRKVLTLRIHAAGDFYSKQYIDTWIKICLRNPYTKFYAYTKSVHLFQGIELPANLRLIFSEGGRFDSMIDATARAARIFTSSAELIQAGYTDCSQSDMIAVNTKSLKIGLIFH